MDLQALKVLSLWRSMLRSKINVELLKLSLKTYKGVAVYDLAKAFLVPNFRFLKLELQIFDMLLQMGIFLNLRPPSP